MPKKQVASDTPEEAVDSATSAEVKPVTAKSDVAEEAEFQKAVNSVKAKLAKQPQVGVFIPLEPGEPKGTQLPVTLNGYRVNVPKGVPNVQVPEAIAQIIWQSLGVYDEASAALRSENDPNRPLRLDLQSEEDQSKLS